MQNNNEHKSFRYSYSASEQAEIKRIREKYAPKTKAEDNMIRLRKLDASVTRMAVAVSLIFGVIGTLILGFGMSLCMVSELGAALGFGVTLSMIIGIAVGVAGGVLIILAYPVYNAIYRRKQAKVAPEIIRITDELMK